MKAGRLLGGCLAPGPHLPCIPPFVGVLTPTCPVYLFPRPIPKKAGEPEGLACLPPATLRAMPVFPPSILFPHLIPLIYPPSHLSFTPSCELLPLYVPGPALCCGWPGMHHPVLVLPPFDSHGL